MGEHQRNSVALAHLGDPEPVILQQMVLMQRAQPDAIVIPNGRPPPSEYRLLIQVGKRSSTIGKRLQCVLRDGATAVDVARALIAGANYLLSVDQDPDAFTEQPETTTAPGARGNGQDHEAGSQAQDADEAQAGDGQGQPTGNA